MSLSKVKDHDGKTASGLPWYVGEFLCFAHKGFGHVSRNVYNSRQKALWSAIRKSATKGEALSAIIQQTGRTAQDAEAAIVSLADQTQKYLGNTLSEKKAGSQEINVSCKSRYMGRPKIETTTKQKALSGVVMKMTPVRRKLLEFDAFFAAQRFSDVTARKHMAVWVLHCLGYYNQEVSFEMGHDANYSEIIQNKMKSGVFSKEFDWDVFLALCQEYEVEAPVEVGIDSNERKKAIAVTFTSEQAEELTERFIVFCRPNVTYLRDLEAAHRQLLMWILLEKRMTPSNVASFMNVDRNYVYMTKRELKKGNYPRSAGFDFFTKACQEFGVAMPSRKAHGQFGSARKRAAKSKKMKGRPKRRNSWMSDEDFEVLKATGPTCRTVRQKKTGKRIEVFVVGPHEKYSDCEKCVGILSQNIVLVGDDFSHEYL